MNTKLITALRTAANALEQNTFFYDWRLPQSCNCGVLFCALTNRSAADLKKVIPKRLDTWEGVPQWKILVGQYCPIAGMPTNELFRELMSFGLTQKDIVEMEFLKNKDVLARLRVEWERTIYSGRFPFRKKRVETYKAAPGKLDYENKNNVVAYMRAWADLLTERGQEDVAGVGAPTIQPLSLQPTQ